MLHDINALWTGSVDGATTTTTMLVKRLVGREDHLECVDLTICKGERESKCLLHQGKKGLLFA